MKNVLIKEILKDEDPNSEYALAILSDYIWNIDSVKRIKELITDDAFNLFIICNTIGNYKCDGWSSIINYHTSLTPYMPKVLISEGLVEIANTLSSCIEFIKPYTLATDWEEENMSASTYNFFIGYDFNDERKDKFVFTDEEKEQITNSFNRYINQLDNLSGEIWDYSCPDDKGWGAAIRLLNNILDEMILNQ